MVAACGAPAPSSPPVAPAPPSIAPVKPAPPPLEFVQRDQAGVETIVKAYRGYHAPDLVFAAWEDVGVFAYARRTTKLMSGGVTIGWLDPGARVGVIFTDAEVAEVIVFAWHTDTELIHATVAAADLGPTAIPLVPSAPTHPRRTVMSGQNFSRTDGAHLGYTFCGDVEVIGETAAGLHVIQREDGVVVEGLLDKRVYWEERTCPGQLVVDNMDGRQLRYHGRFRAYPSPTLPDGVIAAGAIAGPTFAQLVDRRATIWWLSSSDSAPATCEDWQLSPSAKRGEYAGLTAITKLDDGGKLITRFGVTYSKEPAARVSLLGPINQQYDRAGKPGGGASFGCAADYQVIESEPGVLLMHRHPTWNGGTILGYESLDGERWYTDKARCERDLEAKRDKLALGAALHTGC